MGCAKNYRKSKGFTLVEILVVMVIMGLVIGSVYSLFLSNKRTANTSEEVVDVQQNLRVAIETLVADIRMAGFLIPSNQTAITSAPDVFGIDETGDEIPDNGGAVFSLNTISSAKTYARVLSEAIDSSGLLVDADMVGLFDKDYLIHVIRPSTMVDVSGEWTIGTIAANKFPIITAGYVAGAIEPGDMIVRKFTGEPNVANIRYWLRPTAGGGTNNFELIRDDGSAIGATVIASNIIALDLTYLMANGSEVVTTTDYENIKLIRVNLSAETDNTKSGSTNYSGVKRRSLQTLVKIRNASGE